MLASVCEVLPIFRVSLSIPIVPVADAFTRPRSERDRAAQPVACIDPLFMMPARLAARDGDGALAGNDEQIHRGEC